MDATPQPQDQQDRTTRPAGPHHPPRPEPRTCGFCGDRDPQWHGGHSPHWSVKDGKDRCPDCAWMQSGPDGDAA